MPHYDQVSILSLEPPLFIAQNFFWPERITSSLPQSCLFTANICTLLQRLFRYRSDGPITVKEQELTQIEDMKNIFLHLHPDDQFVSLAEIVASQNREQLKVRHIQQFSATFSTQTSCDQAMRDIRQALTYVNVPPVALCTRQERRRTRQNEEPTCTCQLTSVYQDKVYYNQRDTCDRHRPRSTQKQRAPDRVSHLL